MEVLDGLPDEASISHSVTVHNGIANWSIKLPDEYVGVDDLVTLQCSVNDSTLVEPFVNVAQLKVLPYENASTNRSVHARLNNSSGGKFGTGGSGDSGEQGKGVGSGTELNGGFSLPDIKRVHRGDAAWERHGFDENTACVVFEDEGSDGSSTYTFYVNVENIYLRTELKDAKGDVALQQTKFVWGNVLIGLALLHASKHSDNDGEPANVFVRIKETTRALAPFLIPMIDQLGSITEDDLPRLAQQGDEE